MISCGFIDTSKNLRIKFNSRIFLLFKSNLEFVFPHEITGIVSFVDRINVFIKRWCIRKQFSVAQLHEKRLADSTKCQIGECSFVHLEFRFRTDSLDLNNILRFYFWVHLIKKKIFRFLFIWYCYSFSAEWTSHSRRYIYVVNSTSTDYSLIYVFLEKETYTYSCSRSRLLYLIIIIIYGKK